MGGGGRYVCGWGVGVWGVGVWGEFVNTSKRGPR